MKSEIKETCGCGASFHLIEDYDYVYESTSNSHQDAFHRAHSACRVLHHDT
jgi:hypothetical protein